MRALKLSTIAVIAILAIVIPLGLITFADDPPPTTQITASYGSTFTIDSLDAAENQWDIHEGRIDTERIDGIELKNQADVLYMGGTGNKSGLEDLVVNIAATLAAGNILKLALRLSL